LEQHEQQVVLTLGRSAVLDLDQPLVRAQVADPAVAEVEVLSPRQLLVTSKTVGQTQVLLWDEQNDQAAITVVVEVDVAQLKAAMAETVPGATVNVKAINESLVLTGRVPDADAAQRVHELAQLFSPSVSNQLKVAGTQQVLLRCSVVEVSKSAVRQLGVNGWMGGDNLRDMFAVSQVGEINPVNIGGGPVGNIVAPGGIPFATDEDGLPLLPTTDFSLGFPRVQMHLFIEAMRRNGLLRVLAEPNLVALSGQEASFLAGGEFPIPVPQSSQSGGITITIEFKEFGVRLNFTPTVIGNEMIRLHVEPEVSELDFTNAVQVSGFVVPGLTQRRASTTIELSSGTTLAIAGLLSDGIRAAVNRLPALGDIPVLGALFSSTEYRRNRTELVILVTPELASGMHPDQVPPVPGQNLREPNDWELFALGQLEGEPIPTSEVPDDALKQGTAPKFRKYRGEPGQITLHGPWGPAEAWEGVQ
jgi:pilus assembly protein CpaC